MTPERRAQIEAELDEIIGRKPKPKPKVVINNGVPIRDADVIVSPADPNSRYGTREVVSVRRRDNIIINDAEATAQWWSNIEAQATLRRLRREADPFGLGHWGPHDE